jgi:hypothetical protein
MIPMPLVLSCLLEVDRMTSHAAKCWKLQQSVFGNQSVSTSGFHTSCANLVSDLYDRANLASDFMIGASLNHMLVDLKYSTNYLHLQLERKKTTIAS